jgi:hypothetical protein
VSPWTFRCTLVILGSLFGIAILEIGVRALGLAPEIAPIVLDRPYASFESTTNPLLQYVPKPGSLAIRGSQRTNRNDPKETSAFENQKSKQEHDDIRIGIETKVAVPHRVGHRVPEKDNARKCQQMIASESVEVKKT